MPEANPLNSHGRHLALVTTPPPTLQAIYEAARRHGLSHDSALDAVEAGHFTCWCGAKRACPGGAWRHIGCNLVHW